jgi:uncharacterized protein (DUF433 family)
MSMTLNIHADPVPLRVDENGDIRVGNTRVLLDLVVHRYDSGATPEEIVQSYESLSLADVYAVIAYYLRHKEQLDAYLEQREKEADELQKLIESRQPPLPDLKARWQALQAQKEQ